MDEIKMPKVSVIIPAYNVEKYIIRCIDSILGQEYCDIEIIIIDDGSTDSTVDKIKKAALRDTRIKVIQQKHRGPNAARKKGLELASGEYVMFVDADDFIDKSAVAILVNEFQKKNVDVIKFGAVRYESGDKVSQPKIQNNEIIGHEQITELLLTTYYMNNLWSQIYKTSVLKEIKAFDYDIDFGEDFLANLEICIKAERMLLLDNALYYYCDNPASTSRKLSYKRLMKNISDRVFASNKAIKYIADSDFDVKKRGAAFYTQIAIIRDTIVQLTRVKKITKRQFIEDMSKILSKDTFSIINVDELNSYMDNLSLVEKIKKKSMIKAIISADYDKMWQCLRVRKIYMAIRHGGDKK